MINLLEVKQALRDSRFRASLPPEFAEDMRKYLQNPGCACNMPIYRRILKEARSQLQAYFPNKEIANPDEEDAKLAKNDFMVINCHIDELENKLRKLNPGRKQITVARFEDQVTAVVNHLDYNF